MIKFFRHFRQAMIKENRFSKYLLYAIGEIVLVVIGILFAVQINDWNTNRKETLSNRIHLQKMMIEMDENVARMHMLTQDETVMIQDFPPLDEAILNCDSLLRLTYKGLSDEDLPFLLHARFFAGHSVLNLQQDVFEELKSTGRLNSLGSDSLILAIKDFNKRYLREVHYNDEHNDNIIRAIDKLEYGFGKMRQDYKYDSLHFNMDNYPWYYDQNSLEYQNLQIAIANILDSQEKNYFKMILMSKLSKDLKQDIENHLNSMNQ